MCLIPIKDILSNPEFMPEFPFESDFNPVLPEENNRDNEITQPEISTEHPINVAVKKINKKIREKLKEAFPQEALKKSEHNNNVSIKTAYIIERLNECFGIGSWHFKHKVIETAENEVTVLGILSVPEYGISVSQYGGIKGSNESSKSDIYKGAVTNALSKCCSYLEIGIDIYKGLQSYEPKLVNTPVNKTETDNKEDQEVKTEELPEKEPEQFNTETVNIELKSKKALVDECKACNNQRELEAVKNRFSEELKNPEYLQIYKKFETSTLIINSFKYCNTIQDWQKIHRSYAEYHDNDFYKKVSKRRYAQLKNNPVPEKLPKFDEKAEMKQLLEEDLRQEVDKEYITA